MQNEPQKEHRWLQRLVGEWEFEGEAPMGPDKPVEKLKGAESVRSLGGLWILAEGEVEMPGGGVANTLMTLGYDPQNKRYVGSFVTSMMTHQWLYNGTLDADDKALTLETEGPTMTGDGKTAKYKDVIEFESNEHRLLSSYMLQQDGQWHKFMAAHYRRRK